ncbi:MAG: M24 family metallopeptidase [Ferruginibacter sp.]
MSQQKLRYAQDVTIDLFNTVEKNKLIVAGKSEAQLSVEICELASRKFGIDHHWHKKIVRAGKNTLCKYPDNPPNVIIQEDDIVILDFGPVVNGYEADLGRTYIIGEDPKKIKMKADVEKAWYEIQHWYKEQSSLKASGLFQYAVEKAAAYGYTFGGDIAGHIVGEYPHEQPADPLSPELDVHPLNNNDLFLPDANGYQRHWVLELLFIDKINGFGSYFEQLL